MVTRDEIRKIISEEVHNSLERIEKTSEIINKIKNHLSLNAQKISDHLLKFRGGYEFKIDKINFEISIVDRGISNGIIDYETLDIIYTLYPYLKMPEINLNLVDLAIEEYLDYDDDDDDDKHKLYRNALHSSIIYLLSDISQINRGKFETTLIHEINHLLDVHYYGETFRLSQIKQIGTYSDKYGSGATDLPWDKYMELNAEINTHLNTALHKIYKKTGGNLKKVYSNFNDFIYFFFDSGYLYFLKHLNEKHRKRVLTRIYKFWQQQPEI